MPETALVGTPGRRADADAKSYLEALDATSRLLGQELDQAPRARQADLAELGFSTQQIVAFADAAMRDQQLRLQLAGQNLSSRRPLYGQDMASRRSTGLGDVINRRELASKEEAAAAEYFGGIADEVGKGFLNSLNPVKARRMSGGT